MCIVWLFLCILILIKRDKRGLSHLDQNWSRPTSLFLLIIPLPELCLVDASWRWSTDASRHCLSYKPPTVSGSLDYAKNCVTSRLPVDTGRHSLPNKPPHKCFHPDAIHPSDQLHIKEYVPHGSLDYAKKLRLSCKFSTVSVQQTPPINWQLVYGPMVQWSTMVQLHSNAKVLSFLSCDGELEQAWSQVKSTGCPKKNVT